MYAMEIFPHVHLVPGVNAHSYLIQDADGLTLIDTGLPGGSKKILRYIQEMGCQPSDLKRILITHADFDHVSGLAALKAACGAQVYASAVEAVGIASGQSTRPLQTRNPLMRAGFALALRFSKPGRIKVDGLLIDGQVLPVLGGLQVVETHGHTPGHISLFSPSTGVLFAGDSIFTDEKGLHGSRLALTWDQSQAEASLRRQAQLKPRLVCPGHGPVIQDAAGKFPPS
jgi:glyoxylase-like metal-dependent hydrolase (beta-lactamase superfamily II)